MKSDPLAECEVCGKPYVRRNTLQRVCGAQCAIRLATNCAVERRRSTKARKEAAKTLSKLKTEARDAMHAYIRKRDYGKPCICCGSPMPWGESKPGGWIDAGHYMSVGSCPELRYDEQNVHAQLKSCNRAGGTTRASFRSGMIQRVGLAVVERLEGPNPRRNYRGDDLRAIRDEYRAKTKGLS